MKRVIRRVSDLGLYLSIGHVSIDTTRVHLTRDLSLFDMRFIEILLSKHARRIASNHRRLCTFCSDTSINPELRRWVAIDDDDPKPLCANTWRSVFPVSTVSA